MQRKIGTHFYVNIMNFDDVAEKEETITGEVRHSIHELDTFFRSVEAYGKRCYPDLFVVEKITGARLHMYVLSDNVSTTFEIVSDVTKYADELAGHLNTAVSKYKTLLPFCIHAGACFGSFYEFVFKCKDADEMTTIGNAANYAAKLQNLATPHHILVSENIYEELNSNQKTCFRRVSLDVTTNNNQGYCYDAEIVKLLAKNDYKTDFERAVQIANKVDLQDMQFRTANQPLDYKNLSKTECKRLYGVPLFADVREFTSKFKDDDMNLEEMAVKTQGVLTSMYDVVKGRGATDRRLALCG